MIATVDVDQGRILGELSEVIAKIRRQSDISLQGIRDIFDGLLGTKEKPLTFSGPPPAAILIY